MQGINVRNVLALSATTRIYNWNVARDGGPAADSGPRDRRVLLAVGWPRVFN